MKITTLLETNTTPSSDPSANQSQQAPKFGRDPKVLEDDKLEETTTAGAIATGEPTNMGVQRRGKGSMFQGIKTSKKFANSAAVTEMDKSQTPPGRDGGEHGGKEHTAKPVTSKEVQDQSLEKLKKILSKPENMAVLKRLKTKEGVAEAGNKPLEKSRFGTGDTRTPRDIKSQMQGASDEFVKSTADKKTGPFHSKVAKMQGKMAKSELRRREQGVAEGLNEFAPDGFNNGGGDDGEEFNPRLAKMAQEDGFTKGVSLADGATLERAMKIQHWDQHDGGMYKQYFAKGFKAGRMNKINHDNKRYNLNLKLMKDGSIRHGEQGVAEMDKKPYPKTWHDVDPKLGKAVDKMSQAEKVKKGYAHPDTLKKKKGQGVAEGYSALDLWNMSPKEVIDLLDARKITYDEFRAYQDLVIQGGPDEEDDFDYTDYTMRKGEQGVAEAEKYPEPEQEVIDATRRARMQREREPHGSEKIDAMLAQRSAQLQQYNETGKFWLKKKDTQEHISDAYVGKAAANQAALQLLKQHPELKGNIVITAWGPGETPVNEAELSEEQLLARDLKKQLELFKQAVDHDLGTKPNDKELGKKPKDKEVQKKK